MRSVARRRGSATEKNGKNVSTSTERHARFIPARVGFFERVGRDRRSVPGSAGSKVTPSTTCLAVRVGDAPLRSRRPASDGRASPPWRPPDPRRAALGGSPGSGSRRWDARGKRGGSSLTLNFTAVQCANFLSNPVHPMPSDAAMARCAPRRVRARWEVRSAHPDRYARVNSHRHSDRLAPARYGRTAR